MRVRVDVSWASIQLGVMLFGPGALCHVNLSIASLKSFKVNESLMICDASFFWGGGAVYVIPVYIWISVKHVVKMLCKYF